MPKISDMLPSPWLKAADLNDEELVVTIDKVTQEEVGYDRSLEWVLHFTDSPKNKALVLNKTNIRSVGVLYGDDSDDWEGQQITLFVTEVQFQGDMVPAIRIRSKPPKGKKSVKVQPVNQEEHDSDAPPF